MGTVIDICRDDLREHLIDLERAEMVASHMRRRSESVAHHAYTFAYIGLSNARRQMEAAIEALDELEKEYSE